MRFAEQWSWCTVESISNVTTTIREFRLRPENGRLPTYPAGSHIGVTVLIDGQPARRSYSLVENGDSDTYRIAVRLAPDSSVDAPFDDWTIYHIMLEDFANGDAGNDRAGLRRWVHPNYAGGDLQGVLNKVEYLKSVGVNAVWLSPVFARTTPLWMSLPPSVSVTRKAMVTVCGNGSAPANFFTNARPGTGANWAARAGVRPDTDTRSTTSAAKRTMMLPGK